MNKQIISKLLSIISDFSGDNYYEAILGIENPYPDDVSIYKLTTKGESGKGTPFYCGSHRTLIIREDYCDGELVHADIVYGEV